jgi:hypothetical protein
MIRSKEEGPCFTREGIDMMGCGWIAFLMARGV